MKNKTNTLPNWYKELTLAQSRLDSLREDIPRNLTEQDRNDVMDLEYFDMKINAIQAKLNRAVDELTTELLNDE